MKKAAGAGMVVLLAASSVAHANWGSTKWGMTQKQVRAADKSVTDASDRNNHTKLDFSLDAPYVAAGHQFKSSFGFDRKSGALSAVVLQASNGAECLVIRGEMSAKYGAPFSENKDAISSTMIWKDAKNGNRIEFTEVPMVNTCSITYAPIDIDSHNGL